MCTTVSIWVTAWDSRPGYRYLQHRVRLYSTVLSLPGRDFTFTLRAGEGRCRAVPGAGVVPALCCYMDSRMMMMSKFGKINYKSIKHNDDGLEGKNIMQIGTFL